MLKEGIASQTLRFEVFEGRDPYDLAKNLRVKLSEVKGVVINDISVVSHNDKTWAIVIFQGQPNAFS